MVLVPPPGDLSDAAWRVAAVTAHMAIWWITEAVPIPATSLLPIALFPLLGVMPSASATAPYANHLIFLFMGGFFLAVTMERWDLHRRIALHTIKRVGVSPARMVLGFMVATALLSMWVSNTATAMMMVPIAQAVVSQARRPGQSEDDARAVSAFGRCLMLGIAYAASVGGVGTLIGTPPNTVMAAMVDKLYGLQIGFARWMLIGVPLAAVMVASAWLLLTRALFPMAGLRLGGGRRIIEGELRALGPMTREERLVLAVGGATAAAWVLRGLLAGSDAVRTALPHVGMVHDATIGITCALLLFAIPVDLRKGTFLLDWATAVKIPWDVILLFGGGLAIANGFAHTGLADAVARRLASLSDVGLTTLVAVVVLGTIFLTEITSNTATATLLVPIVGSVATALGFHPLAGIVGACLAASFAFMLPVATPPNAVVFGSGLLSMRDMARAGLWMNLLGAAAITLLVTQLMPALWGIDLTRVPAWAN